MGRNQKNIYLFISDENRMYYRATQAANGNWNISTPQATPYPITYNPVNLENSEIEFATNRNYFSLNRSISYPLEFVKDGAAILRHIYTLGKGIESRAYLTVIEWDGTLGNYVLSYYARFDFSQKEDIPKLNKFTVPTVDDSAWGVLSMKDDVTYSIDCSPTNPDAIKVLMTGITLVNRYTYQTVAANIPRSNIGAFYTVPFALVSEDGDSFGIVAKSQTYNIFVDLPSLIASTTDAIQTIRAVNNVTISGTVSFICSIGIPYLRFVGNFGFFLYTSEGQRFDLYDSYIGLLPFDISTDPAFTAKISFAINETINLASNEKLFLVLNIDHVASSDFTVIPEIENTIISLRTTPDEQIVYALRALDLGKAIVEKATDGRYTINSDYYSLNNKLVCTSGNALRGTANSVIESSFKDWFKTFNAIDFLALRVINGELWVEKATEVYRQDSTIFDLGEAIDLKIIPAVEYYANEIMVGSPIQDFRHPSGRLEVNSTNTFSLPFLNVEKKMDLVTKYRLGCYDAQFLILDYKGSSTEDNSGDNSVYVLDITDEIGYSEDDVETFEEFTVNSAPLSPIIKSPLTDDTIAYNRPIIRGIATSLATVNIYADAVLDGTTTADIDGNWSYSLVGALTVYVVGVTTGIHTIQATFTDLSAPNDTISVTIVNDTIATLITYPSEGNSLYNNKPLIKGVAQKDTNVNISINGVFVITVVADASCKWEYKLSALPIVPGNNLVTITANTHSIVVEVDTQVEHPLITYIGSELDGFPIIDNLPLIEGVAIVGTIVQLWLDYVSYAPLGSAVTDSNGNWSFQVVPVNYIDPFSGTPVVLSPIPNGLHIVSTSLTNYTVGIGVSGFLLNRPAYSSITGVTDNTVFNTRISPKKMLENHYPMLSSIMNKQPLSQITFQTADKNANQVTTLAGVVTSERANVPASSLGTPLLLLEELEVKVKVPKTFNELLYNFNQGGVITVSSRGTQLYCLPIGSMKISNIMNRTQDFRLLLSPLTTYQSLLNIYKNGLTISLMRNQVYHSDYNSLHMVTYDFTQSPKFNNKALYDDWFENRNEAWTTNPKYIQKFQTSEVIKDQIITSGISGITLRMYSCKTARVGSLTSGLIATFSYDAVSPAPIPLPDIVLEASIDLSLYPVGQYFFVMMIDGTPVCISERIETKVNWEGTILIESSNSLNMVGAFFATGFKTILRVEGLVKKVQPSVNTITSKDERGDTEMLYSLVGRKRMVRFGTAAGLPDYLYVKVADALALDTLLIEGVAYTMAADEKVEPSEDIDGYPMYYYNVNLDLATNVFGKTFPGTAGANVEGVVLVVDAIAFGMPAGSLINIELPNG